MLRHPQALGSRRRFAAQGADTVPRALPGPGRPLFPAWHGEGSKFPPPSPMPGAASPPLFSRELFRAALGSRDAILRLPAPGQLYAAGEEQRRGLRWAEGGILRSLPRPARLCRRSRPAFCLRPLGSPCVCSMAAPGSLACWKRRPCSAIPSSGAGGQTPACLSTFGGCVLLLTPVGMFPFWDVVFAISFISTAVVLLSSSKHLISDT